MLILQIDGHLQDRANKSRAAILRRALVAKNSMSKYSRWPSDWRATTYSPGGVSEFYDFEKNHKENLKAFTPLLGRFPMIDVNEMIKELKKRNLVMTTRPIV